MEEDYREVYFGDYCKTCIHESKPESEMPCAECLDYPLNVYSHKPLNWKPKDGQEDYIAPEVGWLEPKEER